MFKYILPSLKGYKLSYLKNDLIAGIVVAALTIPVAMGYAEVAGLPPIYGLYASILPVIGYALIASSPQLIFGLDAAASATTGSMLAMMGIAAASKEAISAVPFFAFFTAIFLLIFALLKLGRFANYISMPVMSGFISGVAISIILGQIPKVMGFASDGTNFVGNIQIIWQNILSPNWVSLGIGAATIAVILLAKKFLPKIPMALVALVVFTAVSAYFGFDKLGVTVVGKIPQGFPGFTLLDFKANIANLPTMMVGGFVLSIVVFSDSLLSSNSFAERNHYKIDDNRELLAFSLSNFFAMLTGASPTSSSVSRTAASEQFKGKTQMVSLVAAAIIGLVVAFLAGLLYYMPQPVLSGIIIAALVGVIDVAVAKNLYHRSLRQFIIWCVAGAGVLVVGTLFGVIIGVALSFIDVLYSSTAPAQAYLGVIPGRDGYFDLSRHKNAQPISGVVIYRFSSVLFFANVDMFIKGVKKAIDEHPRVLIVDASGITGIDITASEDLKNLMKTLEESNIDFYFAGQISKVNDEFMRLGLRSLIEGRHTQKTIDDALRAAGIIHATSLNALERNDS